MNYNVLFLFAELPVPIIYMAVAASICRNPPKWRENFGYRTKRALKSESAWNYAQITYGKISTICFSVFAALTLILDITAIAANFDDITAFAVFIAHTVLLVILLFVTVMIVENKLKKSFDKDGKPKENGHVD